jgi:TolA-binding protein
MQCKKCGTNIDSQQEFCPQCGEKTTSESGENHSQSNPQTNSSKVQRKPMPRWFKVVIFLTLLALVAVSGAILFTESIVDVAEKQIEYLRQGNIEKAYNVYTSKDFKAATSLDQFKEFVQAYPILQNNHSALFPQRAIKDHITTLRGKIMASDHISSPIEYRLIKEDGKWKILSVRLLKVQSQNSAKKREMIQLIKNQLSDIQKLKIDQAYENYSSDEFKRATSLEDFEKFIKKYPILVDRHLTSFHNSIIQDQTGRLSVVLRSDQYVAYIKYYFILENNNWKISSMRILSPSELSESSQGNPTTSSQPMEISAITLSSKADDQGLILESSNDFDSDLGDLFVNISIQNAIKDALLDITLKQVDSGSSISSKVKLEEDGDTLLTTIFSPPAGGWLPGHYQIIVNPSVGQKQTIELQIG